MCRCGNIFAAQKAGGKSEHSSGRSGKLTACILNSCNNENETPVLTAFSQNYGNPIFAEQC